MLMYWMWDMRRIFLAWMKQLEWRIFLAKNEAAIFDIKVRKAQRRRFEGETKNLVLDMLGLSHVTSHRKCQVGSWVLEWSERDRAELDMCMWLQYIALVLSQDGWDLSKDSQRIGLDWKYVICEILSQLLWFFK